MTLSIDGVPITSVIVKSSSYSDYTYAGKLSAGKHVISLSTTTATATQALYLDKVSTASGPVSITFDGRKGSAPGPMWTLGSGAGWDQGIETYSSKNVALDGQGHLVLTATRTQSGYSSGWVQSVNKMSFGYGTITARVKVPKGQGLWPAFWLTGAELETLPSRQAGEVDVFELPSTTTTVWSTLHGPTSTSTEATQVYNTAVLPDLSTDFHDYWVRHLENEITIGVDGQTLVTFTPESLSPGSTWIYNKPMEVILNLAVGGAWAGAPDSTTPSTAKMLIDSVSFVAA